jgi:ribosomal protein S8
MSLAFKGKWEKLINYILEKFYEASSIRDFIYREEGIKAFMLAYLNVTPLYFVDSEPEMNKGYADIFLRKNYFTTDMTKYEFIIELKYVKSDEEKSEIVIESYKQKALEQINSYAKSRNITCSLKKIVIVCSSKEVLFLGEC